MQNKANLLDAKMNVSAFIAKGYENIRPFSRRENKPKTNPISKAKNGVKSIYSPWLTLIIFFWRKDKKFRKFLENHRKILDFVGESEYMVVLRRGWVREFLASCQDFPHTKFAERLISSRKG